MGQGERPEGAEFVAAQILKLPTVRDCPLLSKLLRYWPTWNSPRSPWSPCHSRLVFNRLSTGEFVYGVVSEGRRWLTTERIQGN